PRAPETVSTAIATTKRMPTEVMRREAMSMRNCDVIPCGILVACWRSLRREVRRCNVPPTLFNDLIRPQQQRRRAGEAEPLGGLAVDDQLELAGLLDREIGRPGTTKDLIDVDRRSFVLLIDARAEGRQHALFGIHTERRDRRHPMLDGEIGDLAANTCARAEWMHEKCVSTLAHCFREDCLEGG